ncbi:MAG: FAD-dependent oxidoreductase [Nitrospinae bacterium]|nr:FAD-dependent oxidoreductase [Nitrospinota bacterium]
MTRKIVVPEWRNATAPCGGRQGCPAYTNIAGALHALAIGDVKQAWTIMMDSHPLRATLGRVCYGFCEKPCNRGEFDSPISIQMLEAAIGDYGYDAGWRPAIAPANGKKVLITGSGPCGLTAAWFLNLHGFHVEIFEAEDKPGGMLRHGIPAYRLDRATLDREIEFIRSCGVKVNLKQRLGVNEIEAMRSKSGGFDAAIVAAGAGLSRAAEFDGEDRAVKGLDFLKQVNTGKLRAGALKGKHIVVIGGGNVAMDASRSAMRLGPRSVTVLYRRTEAMMPAHAHEIRQAREEGVEFAFLEAPASFHGATLKAQVMALGAVDASGRQAPVPTRKTHDYHADLLITAVGQKWDTWKFADTRRVVVAGDARHDSPGTVIHAIASGRRSANAIARNLTGRELFAPLGEEVTYGKMNVARYFTQAMRLRTYAERPEKRVQSFEPAERIASLEEAMIEAKRCFRCGTCLGGVDSTCDWCFRACKREEGIVKYMKPWDPTGPFYERGAGCDTCSRCWEDCPRHVVTPHDREVEE